MAVGLSLAILLGFHYFYERPRIEAWKAQQAALQQLPPAKVADATPAPEADKTALPREEALAQSKRLPIVSDKLQGSMNLTGGRLDDLTLLAFADKQGEGAKPIVLLSPARTEAAQHQTYYAEWGWLGDNIAVPDAKTVWATTDTSLTPQKPVTLVWENSQGLRFERLVALDEHYMFTITDRVTNTGTQSVKVYPFGLVQRHGPSTDEGFGVVHIGLYGVFDGKLIEKDYSKVRDEKQQSFSSTGGWLGMTDKYWLVAMVPGAGTTYQTQFRFDAKAGEDVKKGGRYQVDYRGSAVEVAAGASAENIMHVFAGAKEVRLLDDYMDRHTIASFDKAIDFGWFYFITKPLMLMLDWLLGLVGNAGVAIIILTVLVKLITLPLTFKSSIAMLRLKELQPQVQALMERYKDDYTQRSVQVMELYKREKVSPFSGCLPVLLQIPVFFALYKILLIGIEMRHAPFFGWITDLSAPDPTTVFNLFGLLPYDVPSFLNIGIWPLLMGASMYLQQKMTPTPTTDPTQQQIMLLMPLIFTLLLAPTMASGLIIYWTWSNVLTIAQQWLVAAMVPHMNPKKKPA